MRIITDLPDSQIEFLAQFCRDHDISRAEAIRRAVDTLATQGKKKRSFDGLFGLWKDRDIDGLDYERRLREEWPE